ncbi:MAG: hypothetical protein LGR52_00605 [Candidatus Thiosymbion ectosymbiont of Robbea hypermnestra]|nr:hypothetical protein [Candidatus Thiosymbion ectosymbiont of Robbea hypermnestra]
MKRSPSYWLWLLADLSLDRAATILPLIDFPAVNHVLVQGCIDSVGEDLNPRQEDKERLIKEIRGCCYPELGEKAELVDTWLQTFPFTDEVFAPAPSYWNLRFLDLLGVDPAPAPNGVDTELWESFRAAFRGNKPDSGYPWTTAFHDAACAMSKYDAVARAIEKARSARLTPHDLAIYMRFGWNDYGTQNGLASLEIGAQLSAVISFWRAVSEYVPAEALESLAYRRDMEAWEAVDPDEFVADAQRYGVRPEQLAADLFPKPSPPPRLSTLLEAT